MMGEIDCLVYIKNRLEDIKEDLDKLDTVNSEYEKELLIGSRNQAQALLDMMSEQIFKLVYERDRGHE